MLIDWFTVGAQALNFVVLVWLLKRLLYKPILEAVAARQQQIAAELADAAAKLADAQAQRAEYAQKSAALEHERAALLTKATAEAGVEQKRLLEQARANAETLRAQLEATLLRDAASMSQAVARRTHEQVFALTRLALTELADTSLEERMSSLFVRRLRALSGETRAELDKALQTPAAVPILRSAFELPAEQRSAIQRVLNETFAAALALRFETAPALISGVELTVGGQRLAWSLGDCLGSLEQTVAQLMSRPVAALVGGDDKAAEGPTLARPALHV